MICKSYETFISAHMDRELAPEQEQLLIKHLENCRDCRQKTQELMELKALCGQLQIPEPSDKRWGEFSDRLLSALMAQTDEGKTGQTKH